MGILTDVSVDVDEDEGVRRVYAVTKWGINMRPQLNRVAGRVTLEAGVGQRTLVSAAYDTEGIDMVWKEGPFKVIAPEDKYPDAKKINYMSKEIDSIDMSSDLFEMLTPRLQDRVNFGEFRSPDATLHIWEIPLDL